ncbi:hypothetical protein Agub_g11154, partial [Astrephomene gubernaculifera]
MQCYQAQSKAHNIAFYKGGSSCTQAQFSAPSTVAARIASVAKERQQRGQSPCAIGCYHQQHGMLPPDLSRSRDECLLQARIGFGERGRGLFFAPTAETPSPPSASASASSSSCSSPASAGPSEPPVLLRVPLVWGLPLVAPGGPRGLQLGLLEEWQSYHGVRLPEQLTQVLQDTD